MTGQPRAFAVGYYGMSNYGDDLFCEVMRSRASELVPGYSLKIIGAPTKGTIASRMRQRLNGNFGPLGAAWRLAAGISASLRGRLLVLGGGSVLWGLRGVRKVQWRLAPITSTRFEALGVSIGPFPTPADAAAVAPFLAAMRRVVVRDRSSVETALELGLAVELGGDLAALYRPSDPGSAKPNGIRRIGIAPCGHSGLDDAALDRVADAVAGTLRRTEIPGVRDVVVILTLNTHPVTGDSTDASALSRRLAEHGISVEHVAHEEGDVDATWREIASLDALVAVRLHAAITAYLSRVPFAFIEYHSKCADFAEDVGLPAVRRLGLDASADAVAVALEDVLTFGPVTTVDPADYTARAERVYLNAPGEKSAR